MATYRTEAAALGCKLDALHQRINVVDELPKLSFVRSQPPNFAPFLVGR
jgi:hypothetical protein